MGIAESSTLTAPEQSDDTLAQSSNGTVPGLAELASTALGAEVLGDPIISEFQSAMQHLEWAEEEIESMGQAHPEHADRIWHSFALLRPTRPDENRVRVSVALPLASSARRRWRGHAPGNRSRVLHRVL
jgi:hypothetical protein